MIISRNISEKWGQREFKTVTISIKTTGNVCWWLSWMTKDFNYWFTNEPAQSSSCSIQCVILSMKKNQKMNQISIEFPNLCIFNSLLLLIFSLIPKWADLADFSSILLLFFNVYWTAFKLMNWIYFWELSRIKQKNGKINKIHRN